MKKCSEKLFGYNLEFTRRVGISGEYTIFTPNGTFLTCRNGTGTLDAIPPASVAFICTAK